MSYRSALRNLQAIGLPDSPPTITCDCCGHYVEINFLRGIEPLWLRNGKSMRGWSGGRQEDGTRIDFCPTCRKLEFKRCA